MLTIKEAADATGTTPDTLRYYEKIDLLPRIRREGGGRRTYDDSDLGWIRFLKLLRETGMPIREMQKFVLFSRESDGDPNAIERLALLREHRDRLAAQIARLQEHQTALENKISYYSVPPRQRGHCDCQPSFDD
jgi:DNA-binding transcriptional MerR regulator